MRNETQKGNGHRPNEAPKLHFSLSKKPRETERSDFFFFPLLSFLTDRERKLRARKQRETSLRDEVAMVTMRMASAIPAGVC